MRDDLTPLVRRALEQATVGGRGLTRVEIAQSLGINPVAKTDGGRMFEVARAIDSLLADGVLGQAIRSRANRNEDRIVFYTTEGEQGLIDLGVLSETSFIEQIQPDNATGELLVEKLSLQDLARERLARERALAERPSVAERGRRR